jgi:hypothetical protein
MAAGIHPFPSRTRQLSSPAPMVLGGRLPGRVGRRRNTSRNPQHNVLGVFCSPLLFSLISFFASHLIVAVRGASAGQPSRTSSVFIWLHRRAILTIAALKLLRGARRARVHLAVTLLGRPFREVEQHRLGMDRAAMSAVLAGARRVRRSEAGDRARPPATPRPDAVRVHCRVIDVVARAQQVTIADVPAPHGACLPVEEERKVAQFRNVEDAMNEAIAGIDRVAHFEPMTADPPREVRGADLEPALDSEMNRVVVRAAVREEPLVGEALRSGRRHRPPLGGRRETRSQCPADGGRNSPRIDQTAWVGTARHTAPRRGGICLVAQAQGRVDRRSREQEGQLPALGDRLRESRVPRGRGHSPIALQVAVHFDAVMRAKTRRAMMTV